MKWNGWMQVKTELSTIPTETFRVHQLFLNPDFTYSASPPRPQCLQKPNKNHIFPVNFINNGQN